MGLVVLIHFYIKLTREKFFIVKTLNLWCISVSVSYYLKNYNDKIAMINLNLIVFGVVP